MEDEDKERHFRNHLEDRGAFSRIVKSSPILRSSHRMGHMMVDSKSARSTKPKIAANS